MNTTEGRLYLTALRSLEKVEIQFVPKEIAPARESNIAEIQIVGRNNPLHHYTGGNDTLVLELDFLAEEESREDVIRKCRMIQSWSVNNGYSNPPERVRLTFGKLFKANEVWLIERAVPRYSMFSPAHYWLPTQAYMQLTLRMDTEFNRKTADVRWT